MKNKDQVSLTHKKHSCWGTVNLEGAFEFQDYEGTVSFSASFMYLVPPTPT